MSDFTEKMRKHLKKEFDKKKNTGVWLNRNIPFNGDLCLDAKRRKKADALFESLQIQGGYNIEQKKHMFYTLLANILQRPRRPISLSLKPNNWKITRFNKTSHFVIKLINMLCDNNLIELKTGYRTKSESRLSRIFATDKLLEYCPEFFVGVYYEPSEVVILTDDKGKLMDYKDTLKTHNIRHILELVNTVNSRADIRYDNWKVNVYLLAIFKNSFSYYGRLHTRGYRHLQGFSEYERSEITINGDPVVELDFSALHPTLLYASEGIQYQGDPYQVVSDNPIARPFLKHILLAMLNSSDFVQAEKAANYWLFQNNSEQRILKGIGITSAGPLMKKFIEAHKPISKYFCKGKKSGLRIMNKDASIALDIVYHFAKRNIPVLAVHDSFLVQEKYRDELFKTMQETYKKHTSGFSINIK